MDCQNIVVAGRGVIDNGAYESFVVNKVDTEGHGNQPVKIIRSRNVTVEGLTVRNARNWNYWGSMSDRVTLRNCKALSPPECNPIWTDGYNFSACQTLLIENCFAYCTDDSFASGHYWEADTRDQKDYVIRGLVAFNPIAHGIRLGFFTEHDLGDITFETCDFLGYRDHGLYIHGRGLQSKAPTYGTVRLVDCGFEADPKGCLIRVGEFGGAAPRPLGAGQRQLRPRETVDHPGRSAAEDQGAVHPEPDHRRPRPNQPRRRRHHGGECGEGQLQMSGACNLLPAQPGVWHRHIRQHAALIMVIRPRGPPRYQRTLCCVDLALRRPTAPMPHRLCLSPHQAIARPSHIQHTLQIE